MAGPRIDKFSRIKSKTGADAPFWKREDIIWAAGLLEGEGSFVISPHKNPHIRLECSSTDLDVLEKLQQSLRLGNIQKRKMTDTSRKQAYRWYCGSNQDSLAICFAVFPFLGVRRQKRIRELASKFKPPKDNDGAGRKRHVGNFENFEKELLDFKSSVDWRQIQ